MSTRYLIGRAELLTYPIVTVRQPTPGSANRRIGGLLRLPSVGQEVVEVSVFG